jgi:predicted permease
MTPPRLARRLLLAVLPESARRVVVGDLDEEFACHIATSRGPVRARLWYWRQALASLPAALRLRGRAGGRRGPGARPGGAWFGGNPPAAGPLSGTGTDLRFAVRLLRRRPGLSVAVIMTFALGIAATTAVLSLANAVLFRPLPYDAPSRLVALEEVDTRRGSSSGNVSWPDYLDYRAGAETLVDLAGYTGGSRTLTGPGLPADQVPITEVTPNFFRTLGVRPALGRDLVPEDALPGAPAVVLLTDEAWRRRFGAAPDIIGRDVQLGTAPATVVGVLPAEFEFPLRGLAELFLPLRPRDAQIERRYFHWLDLVGRLRPGVTLDEAARDLDRIARGFQAIDPQYHPAAAVRVAPLAELIVGDVRPMLLVLLGAGLVLFAIAAANIAGLLLARAATRGPEIGIRVAVGASRGRLVRQLVAESLALAVPASLVGVAAGAVSVRAFVETLPRGQRASLPHLATIGLDPAVVAWTLAASMALACVFGLLPAWRLTGRAQGGGLRRGVGVDRREARWQAGFVAVQVALAVVLLSGAGLMARSVRNLADVSPGFDPEGLLTLRTTIAGERYAGRDAVLAFHAQLLARLDALPEVAGAATIDDPPLTGRGNTGTFRIEGETAEAESSTRLRTVTANYFDVVGVPLLEGRRFGPDDRPGAPGVLLVNDALAREAFDGRALGRRIAFPFIAGQPYWEIVGVVGNERFDGIEQPAGPAAYFHYGQSPDRGITVALRTRSLDDPLVLESAVRAIVADLDSGLPVFAVRSMTGLLDDSDPVFRRRVVLQLVGVFALAALALSVVGLHGVVARTVATRTREIGVRMTLGARGGDVARTTLGRGLAPAGAGLVLGLGGSVVFGRLLATLLFGMSPHDPATLAAVGGLFALVALLACLGPTLRALRIDPVQALRRD